MLKTLKQLKQLLCKYIIEMFIDHAYNIHCNCSYCDLRKNLKNILETVKVYVDDAARKSTYEMMLKHYKTKLNIGYKPPENIPHYFITLSLPPNMPEKPGEEETTLIEKLSNIKYLEDAEGIFEYHGTKGQYHPHIHILAKLKMMNKTNFVKAFHNKLDLPKNFIDIKYSTSPDLYQTRNDYIHGKKRDEKAETLALDVEFRKKHSLINSFKLKDKNIEIL